MSLNTSPINSKVINTAGSAVVIIAAGEGQILSFEQTIQRTAEGLILSFEQVIRLLQTTDSDALLSFEQSVQTSTSGQILEFEQYII